MRSRSTEFRHWNQNGPMTGTRLSKRKSCCMPPGQKLSTLRFGGAYYRLSTDTIRLPAQDRFATPSDYYATALHELGHNADSRIMPRRMLGTHQSLGNPTRLLGII